MSRPTLLLIDDTLDQLDLYEMALEQRYRILRATGGGTGYAVAVREHPHVIVSDVLMPGLDGWGLCQQLRENPETAQIPVVLITAADDPDLTARAERAGAAAVLRKPCSLEKLTHTIDEAARNRRNGADFAILTTATAAPGDRLTSAHPVRNDHHSRRGRILVVDDCRLNLHVLTNLLERDGHEVRTASDGEEALQLIGHERPDLVLMDVVMPRRDGFDTCRVLKQSGETRLIPVVLVTTMQDAQAKITGLEAGADDFLTKPVNAPELRARVRSLLRLKRFTDDLESAESVMLTLSQTIEARNAYTEGHCERLAEYGVALGRTLDLDDDDLAILEYGGFLHDIGKIGIPDSVLLKPARLTTDEFELLKQHTLIGDKLCQGLRSLDRVRTIVRHHHERLDGSGYPDGLRGDQVPLLAQIISIVDVFDALTTARPYKDAMDPTHAYEELRVEARRGWRRTDLVEAFIAGDPASRVTEGARPLPGTSPDRSQVAEALRC